MLAPELEQGICQLEAGLCRARHIGGRIGIGTRGAGKRSPEDIVEDDRNEALVVCKLRHKLAGTSHIGAARVVCADQLLGWPEGTEDLRGDRASLRVFEELGRGPRHVATRQVVNQERALRKALGNLWIFEQVHAACLEVIGDVLAVAAKGQGKCPAAVRDGTEVCDDCIDNLPRCPDAGTLEEVDKLLRRGIAAQRHELLDGRESLLIRARHQCHAKLCCKALVVPLLHGEFHIQPHFKPLGAADAAFCRMVANPKVLG